MDFAISSSKSEGTDKEVDVQKVTGCVSSDDQTPWDENEVINIAYSQSERSGEDGRDVFDQTNFDGAKNLNNENSSTVDKAHEGDTGDAKRMDTQSSRDSPKSSSPLEHETDTRQQLGFFCSYPVENTRLAILQVLRNEWGLAPRLARSADCVIQWSPYSRINWKRAVAGNLIVSSYFAHSGISDKTRLMQILADFASSSSSKNKHQGTAKDIDEDIRKAKLTAQKILCEFYTLDANLKFSGGSLESILCQDPKRAWVLKASKTNNATQVHFLQGQVPITLLESLGQEPERNYLQEDKSEHANKDKKAQWQNVHQEWLLQSMVDCPLLYRDRKFHIRVNVLALGRLRVFVHHDMVLHVASEPYQARAWSDPFIHITNHVIQSQHDAYEPGKNQISLSTLEVWLNKDRKFQTFAEERIRNNIHHAVRAVFLAADYVGGRHEFFPMPNAFEVFGFDFIVLDDADFNLRILEVNHGPALEGHRLMQSKCGATFNESICYRTVSDVLHLVLDGIIVPGRGVLEASLLCKNPLVAEKDSGSSLMHSNTSAKFSSFPVSDASPTIRGFTQVYSSPNNVSFLSESMRETLAALSSAPE